MPIVRNSLDAGLEEISFERRCFPNVSTNLREEQESNYPNQFQFQIRTCAEPREFSPTGRAETHQSDFLLRPNTTYRVGPVWSCSVTLL